MERNQKQDSPDAISPALPSVNRQHEGHGGQEQAQEVVREAERKGGEAKGEVIAQRRRYIETAGARGLHDREWRT